MHNIASFENVVLPPGASILMRLRHDIVTALIQQQKKTLLDGISEFNILLPLPNSLAVMNLA